MELARPRWKRGTASQLTSVAPCRGVPRALSLDVSHIYARTWLARLVEDKQSSMCRCILIDGAGDEVAARRRRTGGETGRTNGAAARVVEGVMKHRADTPP